MTLLIIGFSIFQQITKSPYVKTYEKYVSLVLENKIDQSYELTSKEFKDKVSKSLWSDSINEYQTILSGKELSRSIEDNTEEKAKIRSTYSAQAGQITLTSDMVKEDGVWKVKLLQYKYNFSSDTNQ